MPSCKQHAIRPNEFSFHKSRYSTKNLTWRAEACDIQDGNKQGVLFKASYVVSFAFPQSTTKTISLMVMLASAMFVARTILRTLGGGFSNISFCEQYNHQKITKS